MDRIIKLLFDIGFDFLGFHISVNEFISTIFSLCDWNEIRASDIWNLSIKINEVMVPIGLSLLTLFLMISLVQEVLRTAENISWARIMMIIVKFFILKLLLRNSFYLLSTIMSMVQNVSDSLLPILRVTASTDIGESIANLVTGNIVEQVLMSIIILILYIPFIGTIIGILIQVFSRYGKLIISFCFAPIPVACGMSDDGRNVCKSFLMFVTALGIESIIIMICSKIYSIGLNSITNAEGLSKMIAIMFANGLFMSLISLGSNLAEKFTGGH